MLGFHGISVFPISEIERIPAGAIVGVANITEAGDTLVAIGFRGILGTLSVTEAGDTVAATGAVLISGTASITEAGDTAAATGTIVIAGTASITEAGDTLAAQGVLAIAGTAAITESGDTLLATGGLAITGFLAVTEGGDTLSAIGRLAIVGVLDIVEEDDTSESETISIKHGGKSDDLRGEAARKRGEQIAAARRRKDKLARQAKELAMAQAEYEALLAKYAADDTHPFPLEIVLERMQADDDDMIMALLATM